jgi:hypothetical protein
MSKSHALLRALRLLHLYIGVFTAPALLFFAFTGALQTFSLHETTAGSSYKPPAWAVTLGQIHKKQTPIVPAKRPAPTAPTRATPEARPPAAPAPTPMPTHNPLPLKIFFLLVAIGLCISTITGVYMSWKYTRNRTAILALLLAGIIIPVTMILI